MEGRGGAAVAGSAGASGQGALGGWIGSLREEGRCSAYRFKLLRGTWHGW